METIKDKVFYKVVGFEDKANYATFCQDGYTQKGDAQKVARGLIANGYELVILRCEEIWLRNEMNEFSASIPVEEYTHNGYELMK